MEGDQETFGFIYENKDLYYLETSLKYNLYLRLQF